MAQQDQIQQKIAVQNLLFLELLKLSILYRKYAEDYTRKQKIEHVHQKFLYICKTRLYVNSFFWAFGCSHLEVLLDVGKEF